MVKLHSILLIIIDIMSTIDMYNTGAIFQLERLHNAMDCLLILSFNKYIMCLIFMRSSLIFHEN
jgi:hypothetical protein